MTDQERKEYARERIAAIVQELYAARIYSAMDTAKAILSALDDQGNPLLAIMSANQEMTELSPKPQASAG